MKDAKHRYVSADGPANLREQHRLNLPPAPVGEEALARVQRVHARHLLGAPLQAQLQAARPVMKRPTHAVQIGAAIGAASGLVLLLLGAIQSSMVLATAGACLLGVGLCALAWWSRRRAAAGGLGAAAAPLFDDEAMRRFDAAIDAASAELAEPQCRQLLALKNSMARIGTVAMTVATDEHFRHEDRLYLVECLRRYVPDSLEAYLRVPAAQRRSPLDGQGESAEALLSHQLALLLEEVERREQALGRSAAEGLRRQRRFLESKRLLR
jgi:hypothetical protein